MNEHTRIPDPEHCPDPSVHGNPFRYCPYCTWTEEAAQEADLPADAPTLSDAALVEEAARRGMTVMDAAEAARLRGVEEKLATVRGSADAWWQEYSDEAEAHAKFRSGIEALADEWERHHAVLLTTGLGVPTIPFADASGRLRALLAGAQ